MKKYRILWADDDLDDLMIMREVLKGTDYDYEIVEVQNGKEVLDHLGQIDNKKDYPCLVILDMNMPILNGRDTLVALKSSEAYKSIPVVVFTTSNSKMDRLFCQRYDTEMFTKPPIFTEFQKIIHNLLAFCKEQKGD